MREEGGIAEIEAAMRKLSTKHSDHMKVYGKNNETRLVGNIYYPTMDQFSWGYENRSVAIRIPRNVIKEAKGYFEDRRPTSDCDPYAVCTAILSTVFD
jgi:glutamine synthetase